MTAEALERILADLHRTGEALLYIHPSDFEIVVNPFLSADEGIDDDDGVHLR